MWIWIFIGGLVLGGCFGALVMGVFCGAGVNECKPGSIHLRGME